MIALVTGVGRSQAIGAALCRELAKNEYDVFFTYWHAYDLVDYKKENLTDPEALIAELRVMGVRAGCAEIDLSTTTAQAELFDSAEKLLGTPNVLINNATVGIGASLTQLTPELLDKHYVVNVRSTTLLCKEFVLRLNGAPGKIVNVTSGQSLGAMRGELPYTVTKACADMLVQQLSPELKEIGVNINAFDPGPTDSGWITDDIRAEIEKHVRIRTTEEVAIALIKLLESDVTGQVVHYGR